MNNLSNKDLLDLLLDIDDKHYKIFKKYSLNMLSKKSYVELVKIGFSKDIAFKFKAILELARRTKKINLKSITNSEELYNYTKSHLFFANSEILIVIYVDNQNNILGKKIITNKNTDSLLINFKTILKNCFIYDSTGLFLVHNHLSGIEPSINDIETTKILHKLLSYLNIRLIDHLIICNGRYISIFDYFTDEIFE